MQLQVLAVMPSAPHAGHGAVSPTCRLRDLCGFIDTAVAGGVVADMQATLLKDLAARYVHQSPSGLQLVAGPSSTALTTGATTPAAAAAMAGPVTAGVQQPASAAPASGHGQGGAGAAGTAGSSCGQPAERRGLTKEQQEAILKSTRRNNEVSPRGYTDRVIAEMRETYGIENTRVNVRKILHR
jgi:hypothetical protein